MSIFGSDNRNGSERFCTGGLLDKEEFVEDSVSGMLTDTAAVLVGDDSDKSCDGVLGWLWLEEDLILLMTLFGFGRRNGMLIIVRS